MSGKNSEPDGNFIARVNHATQRPWTTRVTGTPQAEGGVKKTFMIVRAGPKVKI
jgi:hypothetical protein